MSEVFNADHDDAMLNASALARTTFRFMWRELHWDMRRIIPGVELAAVKIRFDDNGVVEHMWVGDVEFDGFEIVGELLNQPNDISTVNQGDVITVPFGERFTDWMLSLAGDVFGAYTIHEIRRRMEPDERKSHDEAWGMDFGEAPKLPLFDRAETDNHPMSENMVEAFENFLDDNPEEVQFAADDGWTMLHHEALAGNALMVDILLKRGADKSAKNQRGNTAAELATAAGWTDIAKRLQ